jgi:lauroyl/myristoyl acyltransferase
VINPAQSQVIFTMQRVTTQRPTVRGVYMSTAVTASTPDLASTPHGVQTPDLATVLRDIRQPLQPLCMPHASLSIRIRTAPRLRRLTPTPIAVARAVRQGEELWEQNPEQRRQALAAIEAIVAGTSRAGEVEELARAHTIENEAHRALFWQPWQAARLDSRSTARLRKAVAGERGVLLSMCHLGPFFHTASLGASVGRTLYAVGGAWCFEQPSPDYWGRRVVRRMEGLREHGGRLVRAAGCFPVLHTLLREGELVLLQFDVPGPRETHFLGKPVALADGSVRLSLQTGAPIVPVRPRREGHRVWMDIEAPLDPHDFAGAQELHTALSAVHERFILELPHTLEDPRRAGSWEQWATPGSWIKPSRSRLAAPSVR